MNILYCIMGILFIVLGLVSFSGGIWEMSKEKWIGVRYTSMSDLPTGIYKENYSDNEITFEQNGKVWKTYKKAVLLFHKEKE